MTREFGNGMRRWSRQLRMMLGGAGMSLIAVSAAAGTESDVQARLKIGFLMDFSGNFTDASRDRRRAFELAIKHLNDGGGVLGSPVAMAVGDTRGRLGHGGCRGAAPH